MTRCSKPLQTEARAAERAGGTDRQCGRRPTSLLGSSRFRPSRPAERLVQRRVGDVVGVVDRRGYGLLKMAVYLQS